MALEWDIKVESHVSEAKQALEDAKVVALEIIGQKVQDYAFALSPVDTGRLRNSIAHGVVGTDEVHIGTNVEYAPYQEFGTSKINAHPYLRPAVERHLEEYKEIIKNVLDSTGDF